MARVIATRPWLRWSTPEVKGTTVGRVGKEQKEENKVQQEENKKFESKQTRIRTRLEWCRTVAGVKPCSLRPPEQVTVRKRSCRDTPGC